MKNPQGREARKPKKTRAKSQAQNFEDVARKLFKVTKDEITPKGEKP